MLKITQQQAIWALRLLKLLPKGPQITKNYNRMARKRATFVDLNHSL